MDQITALSFAASLIQLIDATSKVINYLNDVKDAPKERAKLARETAGLLALLTDLRYRVEDTNLTDPWFIGLQSLGGEGSLLEEFKRAMEELAEKLTPTSAVKKFGQALRWTFEKKEVNTILSKIERLKTLIGLVIQKDHFKLSLAIKDDVTAGFQEMRVNDDVELRQKINQWLAAPDPSSNHNTARKKRQPTTGKWFTQGKEFTDWKMGFNSFIWLHGIPGCGKTILCSTVIEDVLSQSQTNLSAIIYFYFDFNHSDKQRTENLLRSLIVQLSAQCPSLPEMLHSAYLKSHDGQQQPKTEVLVILLHQIMETFNHVYLLIDALDECTDREDLLRVIEELNSWKLGNLHILVTSRRENDIEAALQPLVICKICIQSALVDADIRVHVLERLSNDPKLKKWPVNIREEIVVTLTKGAEGMFRWVVCQLDALRKCLRLDQLRKAVISLPKTLDDTYARILSSINEEYQDDVIRVLEWLCFSLRPMRLNEMVEVLAVDLTGSPRFRPERRFPDPRDILLICSTLVNVSAATTETSQIQTAGGEELRLAHYSVKEYLVSERIKATSVHRYHISQIHASVSIAKTCLAYLLHFERSVAWTAERFEEFPMSIYAAQNWIKHYHHVNDEAKREPLEILGYSLAESAGRFTNWLDIFDGNNRLRAWQDIESRYKHSAAALYHMSLLGVIGVVRMLMGQGADVNALGGKYGNALQAASRSGHEAVVRLLLEQGVDVNAEDGFHGSALQAASWSGHETVVKLLLEQGAEVNVGDGYRGTALAAASWSGHEAVVRLLLEQGANVNAEDRFYGSALQAASLEGHEAVVWLLLEQGADVDADRALQFASLSGHETVVELLLEQGADVNAEDEWYGSALEAASLQGHEAVVRLLLKWGADAKFEDLILSIDALPEASGEGQQAVKRLLQSAMKSQSEVERKPIKTE